MHRPSVPASLSTPIDRLVSSAVNAAEYVRFGGLRTETDPAPFDVVANEPVYRLRHYFPTESADRPAVLLVPPLMQVAEVWDISTATSAVRMLHENGVDPWVVDFGDPQHEPGGAERDVTDHVLAVADAIGRINAATGHNVNVLGYSQGGLFAYQAAAYRRCEGVGSVIALGTPVGFASTERFLPERLVWQLADLNRPVVERFGLPRELVARGFKWAQPQNTIKSKIAYLRALHDRESLLPREPQRKFLESGAWISWPGPAIVELSDLARHDRFRKGGLVYGDRTVGFADLVCPVLLVLGTADVYGPADLCRQIVHAAPYADVHEIVLPVGHFGLPVSSHARKKTWPGVAAWARWVEDGGQLPDFIDKVDKGVVGGDEQPAPTARGVAAQLTYGIGVAVGAGLSLPGAAAGTAQRVAENLRDLTTEAIDQLPQLIRLERMRPGTRISYAKLLADLARRDPDEICFLFDGRAHTREAAGQRLDNVVAGLLSLGVRKGERIGVLMDARPSALVAVAALNRIGAVAVLLRPGADIAREAQLGQISYVVTDPEHAADARALAVPVWVLGGGMDRAVPDGVIDMERLDPAAVDLPSWYRPNPGRARDIAFVLFSGSGETVQAVAVTNGRWALSALAAASAAQLSPADTVYSVSPLHHPSGLLLATAAAAGGGARLAMADRFDPDTFWTEVRRYGATVVPYTWTMLHELLGEPPRPEEAHHPIRLFVGSGMPAGLWSRVSERFPTAAVLELYASTRTNAILGNVSGRKVGCVGKPLPGTVKVRVVSFDAATGRLQTGPDGYAVAARAGETGMLLVAAEPGSADPNSTVLRGLFAADDAWILSGDLFRYDDEGDLWFVDHAAALIRTARGLVSPRVVEEALCRLDSVDLAACYAVTGEGGTEAIAAVTLRPGRSLDAAAVSRAFTHLPAGERPRQVHVVDALPVNSWYRPDLARLRADRRLSAADGAVWRARPGRSTDL